MRKNPADVFIPPLVAAVLTAAVTGSLLITRANDPGPVRVMGVQVRPQAAAAEVVPPPVATPEPAPPAPTAAPGAVAPRSSRPAAVRSTAPRAVNGWIELPSIGVRAPLVAVGLDSKGNMVTPRNARDIAWLDNGSFPGPTRNAIMAGHRNWSGRPGSFERLEQMHEGDAVTVVLEGTTYVFKVTWVRMYDPKNAPVEEIMGETPVDSITLVTCGGAFDRRTHHYTMRWVARAELVEAPV